MLRLLLLLLGLLPSIALAQNTDETFQAALLQSKAGATLVYNGSQHAFTVQFTGAVVPNERPGFLTLNGQLVQANIIGYGSNGDVSDLPEDTQKKFLVSYQQHETNYFRQTLKIILSAEKTTFVRYGNHLFLAWEFRLLHRPKKQVQQQLFLIAICYNQALVLNCPVTDPAEASRARELLAATAATLTLYDHPLDLTTLYKELHP